jgi:hypothetical protein
MYFEMNLFLILAFTAILAYPLSLENQPTLFDAYAFPYNFQVLTA